MTASLRATLLLAAAILVALCWQLYSGDPGLAPPGGPASAAPPDPAAPPNAAHGDAERSTPATLATAVPREDPSPVQPPAAIPVLTVLVRDSAGLGAVAAFHWRFRAGQQLWRGEGAAGRAELELPAGVHGELLVESQGYQPARTEIAVPAAGPTTAPLELFLDRAVELAGITLLVRDDAAAPVPHVRVDAFALADGGAEPDWHLGAPLWARRTADAAGRYVLPALAPGTYGIQLVATDEQGAPRPLLPYRRVFALTGDNGFLEDVPLEPGALLQIELLDATGQPLDPERSGPVELALHLVGAPPAPRIWRAGAGRVRAVDRLPAAGPAALATAVPAGTYALTVQAPARLPVELRLDLQPGQQHAERIPVR